MLKAQLRRAWWSLAAILPAWLSCGCTPGTRPGGSSPGPPGTKRTITPIQFRDVAKESGIDFRLGHGGRTPLNILDTLGHGCAFLDYDSDGWQDAVFVSEKGVRLFRNQAGSPRRFTDTTAAAGLDVRGHWHGIGTGDIDNDGDVDLCLAGYGAVALLRNDHGRFTNVTNISGLRTPGWGSSCGFADLDADGWLDVVVCDYVVFGPGTVQHCEVGGVKTACGPKVYEPRFPRVYRNKRGLADPLFADVTTSWGFGRASGNTLGVAFGDFNSDGRLDVAFANDDRPLDLFMQLGGPTDGLAGASPSRQVGGPGPARFRNLAVELGFAYLGSGETQAGMGIDSADYNGDGREDLIVTNFQNEADGLYRNDGGRFAEVSALAGVSEPTFPMVGWGVRFVDADNNGWPDLIMANGHIQDNVHLIRDRSTYAQLPLTLANDGQGQFRNLGPSAGPAFGRPVVGRGLATGDYDNDGRVDVLVSDLEGSALLLHNESGSSDHWLGLELVTGSPARQALGAWVTIEGPGLKLSRRVTTTGSVFSAHDPRLVFGLGKQDRVERVTIRWPDGTTEHYPAPSIDRYHRLARGTGRGRSGLQTSVNN